MKFPVSWIGRTVGDVGELEPNHACTKAEQAHSCFISRANKREALNRLTELIRAPHHP